MIQSLHLHFPPKSFSARSFPALFFLFTAVGCSVIRSGVPAENSTPLKNYVPSGFSILDSAKCQFKGDRYPDAILVLCGMNEQYATSMPRPLMVLEGRRGGTYECVARGDSIVLCRDCGGIFGDPYEGLEVGANEFTVMHYGGSNWRWTRNISFRYNKKVHAWLLLSDGGISYPISEPDSTESLIHIPEDFGRVRLQDYSWEKEFRQ